VSGCFFSEHIV